MGIDDQYSGESPGSTQRRLGLRVVRRTRAALGNAIREITGLRTNQGAEIEKRTEALYALFKALVKHSAPLKAAPASFPEGVQTYMELSFKEKQLTSACFYWSLARVQLRKCPAEMNDSEAIFLWAKANDLLTDCQRAADVAGALHANDLHRARAGGQGKKKNQAPREAEAVSRITRLLSENPDLSGSAIATELVGLPAIGFAFRTLQKLAVSEKARINNKPPAK